MKIIVGRVTKASVTIDKKVYNKINHGMLVLVGFTKGDTIENIDYLIKKLINLRIFDDEKGIMNKSILDIKGEILSISQFTLYADTTNGNRPSYINALDRDKATILYDEFNKKLNEFVPTKSGIFGAEMHINSINDGPVTIILEK